MTRGRRRLYQAAASLLALAVPLLWLAGAADTPPARDPMSIAFEDLGLMVALGSSGAARTKMVTLVAESLPSDPGLAWLRPVVARELGLAAPPGTTPPSDPDARAVLALYGTPPSATHPLDELSAAFERSIPHPFLRLLASARAAELLAQEERARALRHEARRKAGIAVARTVAASSWFLLLAVSGLAVIAAAAFSRRDPAPEPQVPVGDALGVFVVWWALHVAMLLVLGVVAASLEGTVAPVLLLASGYLAVGGAALYLAARWVYRGSGASLAGALGLRSDGTLFISGVAGLAAAVPVMAAAVGIARLMPGMEGGSGNPLLPALLEGTASLRFVLAILVAVAAPLVEEALFRGLLFPAMRQLAGPLLAIAGSGLIFAVAHADLPVLLPLWALGSLLAYLRHRTGSIVPGMITHGLWNLQTLLLVLLLLGPIA